MTVKADLTQEQLEQYEMAIEKAKLGEATVGVAQTRKATVEAADGAGWFDPPLTPADYRSPQVIKALWVEVVTAYWDIVGLDPTQKSKLENAGVGVM